MHPVKAVPTRCNPFVHGEKTPKKTHSSIKPIKTQKNPLGCAFFKKNLGFLNPGLYYATFLHITRRYFRYTC